MTSSDASERRTDQRVSVHTHCYIVPDLRSAPAGTAPANGPTTFDAMTINVSQGGAFVESDHIPKQDSTLILVFLHPTQRNPIVLQASAKWQNQAEQEDLPLGFGVQFVFTSEEQQTNWLKFLDILHDDKQGC